MYNRKTNVYNVHKTNFLLALTSIFRIINTFKFIIKKNMQLMGIICLVNALRRSHIGANKYMLLFTTSKVITI